MATTSKTRGGTRGLALRQVRWLARAIAARSKARFVEIQRQRGGGRIVLRSADLLAIKQGRWAEQEREFDFLRQQPGP